MQKGEFYNSWSALHGNAKIAGIVKAWLSISYVVSKAFCRLKISPNLITSLGLVFAILLYLNAELFWAPILLVLSLFSDGIDGSMAIISAKSSKWGAILDSIVDRASEIFWMLALYQIGIDLKFLLIIIVIASTQEYIRARSGGLGLSEIGIVTIAERPVRASFVFILLILALLDFEFSNLFVYLWLVFQIASFAMLIKHVRARLS